MGHYSSCYEAEEERLLKKKKERYDFVSDELSKIVNRLPIETDADNRIEAMIIRNIRDAASLVTVYRSYL